MKADCGFSVFPVGQSPTYFEACRALFARNSLRIARINRLEAHNIVFECLINAISVFLTVKLAP